MGDFKSFLEVLKEPVLLEWAAKQVDADIEETFETFKAKFEIQKPWMNLDLYQQEKKHINTEKAKRSMLASLIHTSSDKVEFVNNFENRLKKLGLTKEDIDKITK